MSSPLRVLLVEDSVTDAKLIVQELQRTGRPVEFERVETAEAMRAALDHQEWDVVTADWSMPKFTGLAALGVLQERQLDLPFVIVSGTIGEETAVDAMRGGAHDFVRKDRLDRLTSAIERALRERQERAARRQAESALRESQKRLNEALQARETFLTISSHELKTPLTSLSLNVDSARRLLGKPGVPIPVDELEDKLVRIAFQVARLTALIDTFLDVTRITSAGLALSPETADLREAVEAVLASVRELVARSGSVVSMRAGPPVVGSWDRLTLDSVILNLLSNAIKYGEGKPIEICTEARHDQACLIVADQGIGIPIEDQERIFGRFERAVRHPHFGGFGLGLWVARQIIEAHGGTISVASKPASGSTFTVLLPLVRAETRFIEARRT